MFAKKQKQEEKTEEVKPLLKEGNEPQNTESKEKVKNPADAKKKEKPKEEEVMQFCLFKYIRSR